MDDGQTTDSLKSNNGMTSFLVFFWFSHRLSHEPKDTICVETMALRSTPLSRRSLLDACFKSIHFWNWKTQAVYQVDDLFAVVYQ